MTEFYGYITINNLAITVEEIENICDHFLEDFQNTKKKTSILVRTGHTADALKNIKRMRIYTKIKIVSDVYNYMEKNK